MKKIFITGLVALLPVGLTLFVIWFLVIRIGGILRVVFNKIPGLSTLPSPLISFMGFLALVLIVYIIGVITSNYVGKRFLKFGEHLIERIPIIRGLYIAARKFTEAIFLDKSAFKKVVIIEWPRKGIWTIGFLTNESCWDIANRPDYVNVFIPTTPNPTTGYYVIIPSAELIETDLTVDTAIKTIISGGVILPDNMKFPLVR